MRNLIKTPDQIEKIKKSSAILAFVLKRLSEEVASGVLPVDLDDMARRLIAEAGGKPAFLGYKPDGALHPFPYALCSSVNDVIVHGKPSDTPLKEGDIISLDLGVNWQGGISDAALTVAVGKIPKKTEFLVELTRKALDSGIKAALPGKTVGDIGYAIEKTVTNGGGKIIEGLTGHGVGLEVHEDPVIYNFGQPNTGMELRPGMVIAIEPMVSMKSEGIKQRNDDSFVTADGSLSAHFEHTILITEDGNETLTK